MSPGSVALLVLSAPHIPTQKASTVDMIIPSNLCVLFWHCHPYFILQIFFYIYLFLLLFFYCSQSNNNSIHLHDLHAHFIVNGPGM